MKLWELFKCKKKDKLSSMSKEEKRNFLSMDLIERMIRIEQKVSSSFGTHLMYNQTDYYNNLKESEKNNFNKYLKSKGKKDTLFSILFLGVLSLPILFNSNITGNVIAENYGDYFWKFKWYFIAVIGIFLFIAIYRLIRQANNKRRFNKQFRILNKISRRK